MNERIRLLAEQARESATIRHPESNLEISFHWNLFEQKFAQLIVEECADVAWRNTPETEELEYSHLISDKIKKHFGVEL